MKFHEKKIIIVFLFQEQTQTFGVITMRHDIQGKDGLNPVRPSASTMTQSTSSSSSVSSLGGGAKSGTGTGTGGMQDFGQEQEVYSLLIGKKAKYTGWFFFSQHYMDLKLLPLLSI